MKPAKPMCQSCGVRRVQRYGDNLCLRCTNWLHKANSTRPEPVPEDIIKRRVVKYGVTVEGFKAMLREQANSCAICGKVPPQPIFDLFVDHNHATGAPRGLLCHACNTGIGHLQDSPYVLRRALEYLTERGHYGRLSSEEQAS